MSSKDDRIIEACLEELFGSETPPDLTDRILQAASQRADVGQDSYGSEPTPAAPPALPAALPTPAESTLPSSVNGSKVLSTRRKKSSWMAWAVPAAAAAALVAVVGYSLLPDETNNNIAVVEEDESGETVAHSNRAGQESSEQTEQQPSQVVERDPQPRTIEIPKTPATGVGEQPRGDDNVLASPVKPRDLGPTLPDQEVIAYVDERIRHGWEINEVKPSPYATDAKWCRRVYLDLLGRIPTIDEIRYYVYDKAADKKERLVKRLLFDEEYQGEFARNWTAIWTNLLIGRAGSNEDRPVNRVGLQKWLRDAFYRNKPYNEFVQELIAAEGSNTPGQKNFNGAVNFLLDNLQDKQVPATTKVSQLFLGVRAGCTQCHHHPFNNWKQSQFWGLNAFFKQATIADRDGDFARLADQDFAGEGGGNPEEAEIYYELRNSLLKVAYPTFLDGNTINPSGFVDEVNRRDELAKLVTGSDYMREAIVNRMWAHFLGFGFNRPIDDLGPHSLPSHPELVGKLADQFALHGFDLKRLMQWIVLSKPYSLSSRITEANEVDNPEAGEPPLFSRFYLRQMRAEEVYESLATAADPSRDRSFEERERIKHKWLQQFVIAFNTEENDETTTFNGTIPQALELMNGDLMQRATRVEEGTFLHMVVSNHQWNDRAKIKNLYLAALGREPSPRELNAATQIWQQRQGDSIAALQDIWWALLNSNEFIINH